MNFFPFKCIDSREHCKATIAFISPGSLGFPRAQIMRFSTAFSLLLTSDRVSEKSKIEPLNQEVGSQPGGGEDGSDNLSDKGESACRKVDFAWSGVPVL
jgi:hypothetical protein